MRIEVNNFKQVLTAENIWKVLLLVRTFIYIIYIIRAYLQYH